MTGEDAESAIGKASRRLIPFLVLCYAANFLDRVNVGFAALAMNEDLGFTPEVFGFGAGIFFAGYILFEVPSNLALARFGARIWIARIMISWGRDRHGLRRRRNELLCLALCAWRGRGRLLPRHHPLSHLLVPERGTRPHRFPFHDRGSHRHGGRRIISLRRAAWLARIGWNCRVAWLFIIEGIPAVLLGIVALKFLTNRPKDARWLTPEERTALERRLEAEAEETRVSGGYAGIGQALTNPRVIELGLL